MGFRKDADVVVHVADAKTETMGMIRKCVNCGSQLTSHNPTDFCSSSCDRDYWDKLPNVPFTREKGKTMAVKVEKLVTVTDDLTGEEFTPETGETLTFVVDAVKYEIDLNSKNAAAFRKAFEKYVKAARIKPTVGRKANGNNNSENVAIRAWAQSAGHTLGDRGRIPQNIVDAYHTAHPSA